MTGEIDAFISYMHEYRRTSANTEMSYARDLRKLAEYALERGVDSLEQVTPEIMRDYVQFLEGQGRKSSTISRAIASAKSFFAWQISQGARTDNPAGSLPAPKVSKALPDVLSKEEVALLLDQPSADSPKELRDKAMMEILYATGIRASELISLELSDINLNLEYLTCRDEHKERTVPFGATAGRALARYLDKGRPALVRDEDCRLLFTNCAGGAMSRQGLWKIVKHYAGRAGLPGTITPHTLRHSFAAHLIENGADIKSVQELMGHSDISTTQVYAQMSDRKIREIYKNSHPRL